MVYLVVAVCIIIADQITKQYIVTSFNLFESLEVIPGFFNIVYVTNSGAAFSFLAGVESPWRHYFFLGVGVTAVIGLSFAAWKIAKEHRFYPIALGLIAGGAIGNLIDRVRYGAVVDFLDFYLGKYHWPAFNVADSGICIGAALFVLVNLQSGYRK